jgi:hypothetical protein
MSRCSSPPSSFAESRALISRMTSRLGHAASVRRSRSAIEYALKILRNSPRRTVAKFRFMRCTGRLHAYIRLCTEAFGPGPSWNPRAASHSFRRPSCEPCRIIGLALRRSDQYHHEHDHFIAPLGWVLSLNQAAASAGARTQSPAVSTNQPRRLGRMHFDGRLALSGMVHWLGK